MRSCLPLWLSDEHVDTLALVTISQCMPIMRKVFILLTVDAIQLLSGAKFLLQPRKKCTCIMRRALLLLDEKIKIVITVTLIQDTTAKTYMKLAYVRDLNPPDKRYCSGEGPQRPKRKGTDAYPEDSG